MAYYSSTVFIYVVRTRQSTHSSLSIQEHRHATGMCDLDPALWQNCALTPTPVNIYKSIKIIYNTRLTPEHNRNLLTFDLNLVVGVKIALVFLLQNINGLLEHLINKVIMLLIQLIKLITAVLIKLLVVGIFFLTLMSIRARLLMLTLTFLYLCLLFSNPTDQ